MKIFQKIFQNCNFCNFEKFAKKRDFINRVFRTRRFIRLASGVFATFSCTSAALTTFGGRRGSNFKNLTGRVDTGSGGRGSRGSRPACIVRQMGVPSTWSPEGSTTEGRFDQTDTKSREIFEIFGRAKFKRDQKNSKSRFRDFWKNRSLGSRPLNPGGLEPSGATTFGEKSSPGFYKITDFENPVKNRKNCIFAIFEIFKNFKMKFLKISTKFRYAKFCRKVRKLYSATQSSAVERDSGPTDRCSKRRAVWAGHRSTTGPGPQGTTYSLSANFRFKKNENL